MNINLREMHGEELRHLLAKADTYAKQAMLNAGKVAPAIIYKGMDGFGMCVGDAIIDEKSKENFAMTARLTCVAHGATAAVFIGEGWSTSAKKDQALDLSKRPSQCPDRQEVLMVMGETRYENCQKLLPIHRSESGKFMGFGDPHHVGTEKVKGRFAQFLPQNFPDLETQRKAKEMLLIFVREHHQHRGRDRGFAMG